MRFRTSGDLRRVNVSPAINLLPALREEWASLRFGREGVLVNPLTQEPVSSVFLLGGRHRQVGAQYRITVTTPRLNLPEERRTQFEKESQKLSQHDAGQEAWDDYVARRREASVQVGTDEHLLTATLREDTPQTLAFKLADDSEHWVVEIDIEHRRLPIISLSGTLDLTALLKADGAPGCLAGILGGTGDGTAILDLATLETDGLVIKAQGRANRFRGSLHLATSTSVTQWALAGNGALHGRGLARPILWFAGSRIRRSLDHSLAKLWTGSEARMSRLDAEMQRLRTVIQEEGGPGPFVRRALWDDDFDPGLGSLRSDHR